MERGRKKYPICRLIYTVILPGLLFIAGCGQGGIPIAKGSQPDVSEEPATEQLENQAVSFEDAFYYYLDGERVQLTPSLDWVSVKFASADPSLRAGILQNYGGLLGPLEQAREIPLPALTLLRLGEGVTFQKLIELLDAMRKDKASFLQANPLFHTENAQMAVGDEFIVAFSAGKSRAEIDEINFTHGVELVQSILGQENTFILRVSGGAELDVLSMANFYQENGLALHAAPNFIRIKIK